MIGVTGAARYHRRVTQPPPVADSVRLAWPTEASAVAALQRRGWQDLPDPLGAALLAEVDEAAMVTAWEQVVARPADARSVADDHG